MTRAYQALLAVLICLPACLARAEDDLARCLDLLLRRTRFSGTTADSRVSAVSGFGCPILPLYFTAHAIIAAQNLTKHMPNPYCEQWVICCNDSVSPIPCRGRSPGSSLAY